MGFTISYAAVTWTAGDVITEAKMDNMVANDQAYDSHSAQGFEIDEMAKPSTPAANKVRLYAKEKNGVSNLYYLKDSGVEIDLNIEDGWTPANETPTYASAVTITVASGAASKYKKGDKIKFTQHSSVKYFYVIGVADTVLTLIGNGGIGVENTGTYPITLFNYSHASSPIGFPDYFTWVPSLNLGNSILSGYDSACFTIEGNTLNFWFYASGSGSGVSMSGSAGTCIISLPVNANSATVNMAFAYNLYAAGGIISWCGIESVGSLTIFKSGSLANFVGNETGIFIRISGSYLI